MPKTVTIKLSEPITAHRNTLTELTYREPRFGEILGVGAPFTVHLNGEGKPFAVYDEAVIKHYAEICLVDADPLIVESQAGLNEAMQVREAIIGFFLHATEGAGGSKTSQTPSSSASDGSPTPSAG